MESIKELQPALAALTPGVLILFVRSRFVRAKSQEFKDAVLSYLVISTIYLSVVQPLAAWMLRGGLIPSTWIGPIETVALPLLLGLLLGASAQGGWGSVLRRVGLRPLHPTTSAWDWAFVRSRRPLYALVTLKSGEQVAGLYAAGSFAGSEEADRDLYLETTFLVGDDGRWLSRREAYSVLVRGSEIRLIELTEGSTP